MSTEEAVKALLAMETPERVSLGYRSSLYNLKVMALVSGYLTAEDEAQKEAYMARCRESSPSAWFILHMLYPERMSEPEVRREITAYMEQLSPEQGRIISSAQRPQGICRMQLNESLRSWQKERTRMKRIRSWST